MLTNRLQSGLRVNFSFRSLREIVIIFVLNNWFEEIIELNLSIYFSSSSYLRNEYDYKTVLHLDLEDTWSIIVLSNIRVLKISKWYPVNIFLGIHASGSRVGTFGISRLSCRDIWPYVVFCKYLAQGWKHYFRKQKGCPHNTKQVMSCL